MFTSATQLKDWIKNKSKQTGTHANEILQNYMLERFLERISLSPYRENMILKGGFLIAAMVGIDRRSTMDMDTTIKGLPVNINGIENMLHEIISVDAGDGVSFEINDIKNIHEASDYDDFRISLSASFHKMKVSMKLDITTGDSIIPCEIEYHYKLMFEERTIPVMAYNLNTILAEKIETILTRGVGNTRARDFYDIYLLIFTNKNFINRSELIRAIKIKTDERKSVSVLNNYSYILNSIATSPDVAKIWNSYKKKFHYAKDIDLPEIVSLIEWIFENSAIN